MQIRERQCYSRPNLRRPPHSRRGALVLEFVLTLPVLIIMLLAVIEFALIMQVNQIVAAASRHGAKLASEMPRILNTNPDPNLGNFNSGTPETQLKTLVDQFLAAHGLTESCVVFLEHNACGVANSGTPISNPTSVPADCHCSAASSPVLPGRAPPEDVAYVRVTVGVPLNGNVPNLLSYFGFDLGESTFQQTTTMRLETNNQPPTVQVTGALASPLGLFETIDGTSFPLGSCGQTVILSNELGDPSSIASITVNFDATGTMDPEQGTSNLQYLWSATIDSSQGLGAEVNPLNGNSPTFQVELGVPVDPNQVAGNTEGPNFAIYKVTLTVTDQCGASSSCTQTIEIRTQDSQPAP